MAAGDGLRLTRVIKRYLDVFWWANIFAVGAILLVLVLIVVKGDDADGTLQDTTAAPIVLRFALDSTVLNAPVNPEALLQGGQGELRIRTRNTRVWMLFMIMVEATLLAVLYGMRQLRAVLRSLLNGEPFSPHNPGRIRRLGYLVVGWHTVMPFLKYWYARAVIDDIHVEGLTLKPPIDINLDAFVLGLAVIVLAEIFRKAGEIQRDQALTV